MQRKIDRYEAFYDSGDWRNLDWQPNVNKVFPYILLISRTKYRMETNNVKLHQFKDIAEFLRSVAKSTAMASCP